MHANKQDFYLLEKLLNSFLAKNPVEPVIVIPTEQAKYWGNMTGYRSGAVGPVKVRYENVSKIVVVKL